MSEDRWAAITSQDTALLLAALAVYLGGAVGIGHSLPRLLLRSPAWQSETARHPLSSAVTLTALIVLWPVSLVYLACRTAARRRQRRTVPPGRQS
ncbi:hypothetical protein OHA74_55060 [Streptomyces phaeochromogenes]|uniref:hypothetical protein n=1 Tax=Streptomyces phaeochromogenes TaxID=1923 RepID=UPI002E2D2F29|nr:hypothetical protein [Streptomyces phaeochromogenes]